LTKIVNYNVVILTYGYDRLAYGSKFGLKISGIDINISVKTSLFYVISQTI